MRHRGRQRKAGRRAAGWAGAGPVPLVVTVADLNGGFEQVGFVTFTVTITAGGSPANGLHLFVDYGNGDQNNLTGVNSGDTFPHRYTDPGDYTLTVDATDPATGATGHGEVTFNMS